MGTNDLILAYSGTDITADILKSELESAGISALLKSEAQAALTAGFGSTGSCDVYILKSEQDKATPIINAFISRNDE